MRITILLVMAIGMSAVQTEPLQPVQDASFRNIEKGLGNYYDQYVYSTNTLLLNPEINAKVSAIGNSIVRKNGLTRKYTFRIINDPVINAFSSSGGYVYITTGLLEIISDIDELAAVLAHEIAHNSHSHILNGMKQKENNRRAVVFVARAATVLVTRGMYGGSLQAAASNTPGFLTLLERRIVAQINKTSAQGHHKKLELEADDLAIKYVVNAGYDPYGMIRMLKKLKRFKQTLAKRNKKYTSALLNKDPGIDLRMSRIYQQLQGANKHIR